MRVPGTREPSERERGGCRMDEGRVRVQMSAGLLQHQSSAHRFRRDPRGRSEPVEWLFLRVFMRLIVVLFDYSRVEGNEGE